MDSIDLYKYNILCYRCIYFKITMVILMLVGCVYAAETFSDRPIWWHDMVISVPTKIIDPSVAFIYIGSGSNEPERYCWFFVFCFEASSDTIHIILFNKFYVRHYAPETKPK